LSKSFEIFTEALASICQVTGHHDHGSLICIYYLAGGWKKERKKTRKKYEEKRMKKRGRVKFKAKSMSFF
jgi:hypothetical protein